MSLKPCKFTPKGSKKELSYDEFRQYLLDNFDELVEPPTETPEPKKSEDGEGKKKALIGRIFEGTGDQTVKETAESLGLLYDVERLEDAEAAAERFLKKSGLFGVIEALQNGDVVGAPAAYLWVKAIDKVNEMMLDPNLSVEDRAEAERIERELIDQFDKIARTQGRFLRALADAYTKSDLGYRLSTQINKYEEITGEKIPDDVKARFEEYDRKLSEAMAKLKEYEENELRAKEEKEAVENIAEDVSRSTKKKAPTTKEISTKLAAKVRSAKINKPSVFNSSVPGAVIWDGAVEVVATVIEAGGSFAEALQKGLEYIKESDFYKGLTEEKQKEATKSFKDTMNEQRPKIEVTDGKVKVPISIIRELVSQGVTNMDDLAQSVLDQIKEENPDLTLRDVKDAITGYGRTVNPTKDELQRQINTMKRVGRLQSKLEDVQARSLKLKDGKRKTELTKEEKKLKAQIQQELESLPEYQQLRTDAAKERIKQKIADLERRIREQDFSKKQRKPVLEDSEMVRLEAEKRKWQEAYDKEMYKAELKSRGKIEKLLDGFVEIWNLPRTVMATFEMSFMLIQGWMQSIAHPKTAARAFLKAIQYGWSEAQAQKWGEFVKAQPWYNEMKKSKLALSEYDARLDAREEYFLGGWINNIWDVAGYALKALDKIKVKDIPVINKGRLKVNIKGGTPYEIWKQANPIKAIERASVGYLNTIRVLRYLDGKYLLEKQGKTFEKDPQDYKNMADAINTMTGRAGLGPVEESQRLKRILPIIFFSPRNWASLIKTVTPYAFIHFGRMGYKDGSWKPSVAQKMYVGDFMKSVTATTALLATIAAMYNDDEDEDIKVELDPRSSDWGTVRIGNTRIDPWGGRKQMIVLQARMLMDAMGQKGYKSTRTGEISYLGQGMTPTKFDLGLRMVQNKLSPSAALAVKYAQSKIDPKTGLRKLDFGEDFDVGQELAGSLYPMYVGTINELWEEQPETVAGFLTAAAFFGVGVSTYGTLDERAIQKEYDKLYREVKDKIPGEITEEQNKKLIEAAYKKAVEKYEEDKKKRRDGEKKYRVDEIVEEYKAATGSDPSDEDKKKIEQYVDKQMNDEASKEVQEAEQERIKRTKKYIEELVKKR